MNSQGLQPGIAIAGFALCALIGAAGWLARPAALPGPPPPKEGEPHAPGPITFFADHCARCHGQYGADYNDNLYQDPSPDRLAAVVRAMIEGQTELAPTYEMLRGQTALAVAMGRREPFIAWTGRSADGRTLLGEATPGATLSAVADGRRVDVAVADGSWSVTMPDGCEETQITLSAEWNGKHTRFTPGKLPFAPAP